MKHNWLEKGLITLETECVIQNKNNMRQKGTLKGLNCPFTVQAFKSSFYKKIYQTTTK